MRYNTGNPVEPDGSSSPFDLHDNSGNLDLALHSQAEKWLDRLGISRPTWNGLVKLYVDFIKSQGYEPLFIAYEQGAVIQRQTQLVQRDGELFRISNINDLPYTLSGIWDSDLAHLEAVGDAQLRQALAASAGGNMVGYLMRSVAEKLGDSPSPLDFGAKGDGYTDDSAAFQSLELAVSGRTIDLSGKTYALSYLPLGNAYINGYYFLNGKKIDAYQDSVTLASASDTGGTEDPYAGGANQTPTVSGRGTPYNRALIASSSSRAMFVRSTAVSCIYTWVKSNLGIAAAARQCVVNGPQAGVISAEECQAYGFRASHFGSVFSEAMVSTGGTMWSRLGRLAGSYVGLIATNTARIGSGRTARLTPVIVNGSLSSINVENGGLGWVVADTTCEVVDRSSFGSGAKFTITVDANGKILTAPVTDGGFNYTNPDSVEIMLHQKEAQCAIAAATNSTIAGPNCANSLIAASSGSSVLNAANAYILGSDGSTISGNRSGAIGSSGATVSGNGSLALNAVNTTISVDGAVAFGRRGNPSVARSLTYADSTTGSAAYSNTKFEVTPAGNIRIPGQLTPGAIFTDYGEYFPNVSLQLIPLGTIVTLDGDKVRSARKGDRILGVVSATAAIVSGDSPFHYAHKYLLGEFDEPLFRDVEVVKWEPLAPYDGDIEHAKQMGLTIPEAAVFSVRQSQAEDAETGETFPVEVDWVSWDAEEGFDGSMSFCIEMGLTVPARAVYSVEREQIINPDYDPGRPNIPRSERPEEWTLVGLLGQVRVRVGKDVKPGDFVAADGTVSDAETNLQCMRINHEWSEAKGYAVALAFIR